MEFYKAQKKIESNLVSIMFSFLKFFKIEILVILIMRAKYPSSKSAQMLENF